VYDYFYELMKEVVTHKPKNLIDFLIERISKSETYRCVIIGPPGFSRLGLGSLISGRIGWKYLNMSDWISKEVDLKKDIRPQKPVHERLTGIASIIQKGVEKEVERIENAPGIADVLKSEVSKETEVLKKEKDDKKEDKKEDVKKEEAKKEEKKDETGKKDKKDEKLSQKSEQENKKKAEKKASNKASDDEEEETKKEQPSEKEEKQKEALEPVEPELPPPPPKCHTKELNENMLKYREEILAENPQEDLINAHLYEDIKYSLHSDLHLGLISDSKAIEIFKKYTKEYEHECWVLEGFPKTRVQAISLAQNKIIPDKIFLMKYSDEVAIEHIIKSLKDMYGEDTPEEELQKAARRTMIDYHMNIREVEKFFKNVIHIIDANKHVRGYSEDTNKVSHFVDEISRLIQVKRMSPDRKLRIIIVGSPGSGRSTQAEKISTKYGLVHVSTSNLLKNEIRLKTERGKRIKD
jgi:adenylate kinase family enzyme